MSRAALHRFRALVSGAALILWLLSPALAQDFFSDLFGGDFARHSAPRQRAHPQRQAPPRFRAQPRFHAQPRFRAEPRPRAEVRWQKPRAKPQPHRQAAMAPAKQETKPAPEPAKAAETPPQPYDAQMQRLTEILGGLSYLRDLCGDGDGDYWRSKAAQLQAEAPQGAKRLKLTAAFNRGFRGYELTYRACTPNARQVIARYLAEAEKVSREVTTRYGNP